MDFGTLPEEVFLQILAFLGVEDLLYCSLVSRYWREIINKDWLWKRVCSRGSETKKITHHLANEEEQYKLSVEEGFNVSDSTLQPLCKWRLNYMRYIHFTKKLQAGLYRIFNIPLPAYCSGIINFYGFVLFKIPLKNLIEIWNIKGRPYLQCSIKCLLHCRQIQLVEVVDDFLVVLQYNLLQVYKNSGSIFDLQYRRLFNMPQENSECIPQESDITRWYEGKFRFQTKYIFGRYIVTGDYFVGLLAEKFLSFSFVMHIWNIKTGDKLKELEIPYFQGISNVSNINVFSNNKYVFIILSCEDGENEYNRIVVYNLKTHTLSNFNIEVPYPPQETRDIFRDEFILCSNTFQTKRSNFFTPYVIFKETFLVTLGASWKTLIILEAETGEKLANTSFDYTVFPQTLDVYDSYIGFIAYKSRHEDYLAVIMNFEKQCLKIVCSMNIGFQARMLRFLHYNFILVESFREISVWDIKKSYKLYTVDCEFYLSKNSEEFCVKSKASGERERLLLVKKLPFCLTCYKRIRFPETTF